MPNWTFENSLAQSQPESRTRSGLLLKCVGIENVRPGTLASDIIVLRASFIFGIHAGKMPAAQMPGAQVPAAKVPAGKAVETLR